ncbi:hypothetical protein GQ457_10G008160 [Hibiscus cannabinus]
MLTCFFITPSFPPFLLQKQTPKETFFPQLNYFTNHSLKQLKPTHFLKPLDNPKPALFYFDLYLQLYINVGFMQEARYAKHGLGKEALALFKDMMSADKTMCPNSYVYAVVLRSCGEMRELGFDKGLNGQNSLVNMYSSYDILEDFVLIFDRIEKLCMVAWSSMLGAYVKNGLKNSPTYALCPIIPDNADGTELADAYSPDSVIASSLGKEVHDPWAFYLHATLLRQAFAHCRKFPTTASYMDILERGGSNENIIIASKLKWRSLLSNLDAGKIFHSLAKKLDVHFDPYVTRALIDMFSKCGKPEATLRVFERVEDPCTVTWSTLISGLSWNGWFVEALTCFQKMQLNGIEANEFTLTFVILASVALDAEISWNLLIHACLKANDYEMPAHLHLGMQAQAYMAKRGLLSYPMSGNGLIQMYSECGQIAAANLAFELMLKKTSLSWTSIISAKVKHGHPSEALALFNDMRRRNKLVDSSTLKSILKACGRMGRVDEVIWTWQDLLWRRLDPIDCFANLLLDKVLVMFGKWKDASKTACIGKTIWSNSSCIEVKNKIYKFVSNHNPSEEVSDKLAELEREMEGLEYVADRNHLLHDVEEEEYDGAGLGHTEMKANTFEILSLLHRIPVRVTKSVRMCGSCHSACKFMSIFVDRELVVKDNCTFYHLRDGSGFLRSHHHYKTLHQSAQSLTSTICFVLKQSLENSYKHLTDYALMSFQSDYRSRSLM